MSTTTRLLALPVLLTACVASPDDPTGPGGGKGDGSEVRSLSLAVDRRPVDGALTELHVEALTGGGAAVVVERTTRSRAGDTHHREVLIESGSCGLGLDELTCEADPDVADVIVTARRTGDTWIATSVIDGTESEIGSGMQPTRLRFSRDDAELTIDRGAYGQVATLRTTPTGGAEVAYEPRTLFTSGTCAITAGELTCAEDRRPVDGALNELHVALVTPGGPYRATLRTAGVNHEGPYDRTETLAEELDLR